MGRVGADGLLPRFIWAAPLVGVVGETARGRRHDGTSGRRAAAAAAILDGAAAGDLSLSLPVVRSRLPTPFGLCSSTFWGGDNISSDTSPDLPFAAKAEDSGRNQRTGGNTDIWGCHLPCVYLHA
jgi:hypothetical protein